MQAYVLLQYLADGNFPCSQDLVSARLQSYAVQSRVLCYVEHVQLGASRLAAGGPPGVEALTSLGTECASTCLRVLASAHIICP